MKKINSLVRGVPLLSRDLHMHLNEYEKKYRIVLIRAG